ncbi:peptidoglycan/xylan/chitin deacetylase (PgdA/CDA1 family) [Dysgonomonas sp. PH5-45]|uniref:polysaccharide deacetylase family protein n=1 Tax=unclassified Dysgonomonas TaxID=2630389 RepID=UPI0024749365|nr:MULTISPECIES: polysaccharide deacetylase family protein [unclassified Dysgonomonas]MDH6356117.1 peptidoglycan/xylan/chitin deacetylase (PgdA/CDA1 family) [Dysgonomonas sp. PH5-45]MDH6389010.1 peptidoglycan/xylan/chitin deacetylase (PgdA/CDA1 family) [Dysgonomonas sp. PH5-37]
MILLSFDIEEFEMPREYGDPIPFEEQISLSVQGTNRILDMLKAHGVKATFYTTANFAQNAPDVVHRIVKEGHELASHGYYHDHFKPEHLRQAKEKLEEIGGVQVQGFRMPRMMPVPENVIYEAGYTYNSSINPTFLPGRYNNLHEPRTYFRREGVWQMPASVTPLIRFPLFWIAFHNLSLSIYKTLAKWTLKKDGYLNIYFHPWEFLPIGPKKKYNFPFYVTRNTDMKMYWRLGEFIEWGKKNGYEFACTGHFVNKLK